MPVTWLVFCSIAVAAKPFARSACVDTTTTPVCWCAKEDILGYGPSLCIGCVRSESVTAIVYKLLDVVLEYSVRTAVFYFMNVLHDNDVQSLRYWMVEHATLEAAARHRV